MVDVVLEATRELEAIIEEGKEKIEGGVHLKLCDAIVKLYKSAKALQAGGDGSDSEYDGEYGEEDEEEAEESDEEPRERTEDDMELNELSDLWECHFDFGRRRALMPLQGLTETIVEGCEAKRVCAAVRVLNRAMKGSKPSDPADAEKILQWKEQLIEERAIRVCSEILEKFDDRGFHNENHDEHWLYSILCDEIVELFERLAEDDALFRTKMRRNGALAGMQEYASDHPRSEAVEAFLCELQQRH